METEMDRDLKNFCVQWTRVAVMALAPVVFAAFATIPYSLGGHPGEQVARTVPLDTHMT